MPVAVSLRLDQATADRINGLVHSLPDRRIDAGFRSSHMAHITLLRYDDHVDLADLDAALATATIAWQRLHITLGGIGVFAVDPPIVCLTVVPTIELLARHAILHEALPDLACHPLYEPGGWVPHVSLADTVFVADSVEVITAFWTEPISGTADFVDLVSLEPFQILSSRRLRD